VLQTAAISYLGLSLPDVLRAEGHASALMTSRSADACILIFLDGGPSHLDMWDMKPSAPVDLRGEFSPIATSVPGFQVCEHLPRMAGLMQHATVLRSAHHSVNNSHAAAVYAALTGHDRGEQGGGARPTDNPAIGSVVGKLLPPRSPMVPYVSMPYITKEGAGGPPQPGFFGGWMGRTHDPFIMLRDPNEAGFSIQDFSLPAEIAGQRFSARKDLLRDFSSRSAFEAEGSTRNWDEFQQKAFDLLASSTAQQAFGIEREPAALRESYGRNIYGQSVLLARRLIEAGTRVACVSWAPDANATWDTHGNNFKTLKETLLPQLDAAVASLLSDLLTRNMLERTLVVVMGEFGRSPRINAGAGRDHWNSCYSLMMAGGGIKGGHVFGASDRTGSLPLSSPVTPADIVATIYHCLGIPKNFELHDNLGRPFTVVPTGDVIVDVLTGGPRPASV